MLLLYRYLYLYNIVTAILQNYILLTRNISHNLPIIDKKLKILQMLLKKLSIC